MRQLGSSGLNPVEHIDLIDIGIGIRLEIDTDLTAAFAGAIGGDVVHPWGTIDLLLKGTSHCAFNRDRISAGQVGRHLNRGRRNVWQVFDRQQRQGNQPGHQDQDAAHGAEHRATNESVRKAHWPVTGSTMPLRSCAKLPITTFSVPSSPFKTG